MNLDLKKSFTSGAKVRLSLRDAKTQKLTWRGKWQKNLFLDVGLNALANNQGGYANTFTYCKVGSGINANSVNTGGSAILSQSGNTVTASSAFFTSNMVGALLKFGNIGTSNGLEQYITAFTSSTQVTVSTSTTQSAVAGTVWFVNQTGLQTFLYQSNTYPNGGTFNGYTLSGNTIVYFRTFNFAVQGSSYSVNEIGYDRAAGGTTCLGRIVLGSTVTVPTTNFLVVEIQMTVTQTPGSSTAVGNVGTGFNTAGNLMWQVWNCSGIGANGNSSLFPANGSYGILMDQVTANPLMQFYTGGTITLNGSIQNANPATSGSGYATGVLPALSNTSNPVGVGTSAVSFSFTTAGETCSALVFGGNFGGPIAQLLVLNLTTPVTLPVGTFSGNFTYQANFTRTLTN